VNFTGNCSNINEINNLCKKNGLYLLEDGSQSYGGFCHDMPSGSFGDISVFSVNAMKVLGSFGECGIAVSNNELLISQIKKLRYLGFDSIVGCQELSLNYKLEDIQASFALKNLLHFENKKKRVQEIAKTYSSELSFLNINPALSKNGQHAFFDFQIIVEKRDELLKYLNLRGVEARVRHIPLIHRQPYYQNKYGNQILKKADWLAERIISLPIYDGLSLEEVDYVVKNVKGFYGV